MDLKNLKNRIKSMKKLDDVGSLTLLFSFLSVSSALFLLGKKSAVASKKIKAMDQKTAPPYPNAETGKAVTKSPYELKCVSNAKSWKKVQNIYANWQQNQWQNWLNWSNWCEWSDWSLWSDGGGTFK